LTTPTISVIVLAHDRRQYLTAAIDSLLQQDLDRNRFEIIVVKNFADEAIDARLEREGVHWVRCDEVPISAKVAEGIRQSQGAVLTFLEDDDLYETSRLRQIWESFQADPQLGFYRNRFTYIGADGKPLRSSDIRAFRLRRITKTNRVVLRPETKLQGTNRLIGQYPDFNLSSSAIHRRVVDTIASVLTRVEVTIDTLLFFAALVAECSILLDGDALTRYRVHGESSTLAGSGSPDARIDKLLQFADLTERDYLIIREFVATFHRETALRLIDARIWVNRLTRLFRSPDSQRRGFLALLRDVRPLADTYPVREDLVGVVGILPFLVSPSLGRRLYHRQVSVR